jgi:hypothetical protein
MQDQHAQDAKAEGAQHVGSAIGADQERSTHGAQPGRSGGCEQAELGVHECRVGLGLAEKQHVKAQA